MNVSYLNLLKIIKNLLKIIKQFCLNIFNVV